jgi:hypothetical protein
MTEQATVMGATGKGVVSRVDGALEFAQKLLDTNPLFARANPSVGDRLKKVAAQDRHYLAHEYFNKDWHPMHFATLSDWLGSAKIDFACSANYLEHVDALNLTPDQQKFLSEISDASFKESVRDFMVNQQFRKDYWVKGARKLSVIEKSEMLKAHRLILTSPRADVPLKLNGALGEADLSAAIYTPILDLMSDHKIRTIEEIVNKINSKEVTFAQVIQAAIVLIGTGHMASAQNDAQITKAKQATAKLNLSLMSKARFSTELTFLASPVTGGGVAVNRFQQLYLLALTQGKKLPKDWAQFAWSVLASQNQRLLKEGVTIESADENLKELTEQAERFEINRLPILKALQIA